LGPGLLESAYEECLLYELHQRDLRAVSQKELPITYGDIRIDAGYRIDLLVEDQVILELKVVDKILPIHKAQLLSYLKLSNLHKGLLLNFNVEHLRDGIVLLSMGRPPNSILQQSSFSSVTSVVV
jgi:GxxExxY protein